MTTETASPAADATVYDIRTPVQVIAGKVSDALSFKLPRCIEKVLEILMDMGLMDWGEFTHFGYDSKPPCHFAGDEDPGGRDPAPAGQFPDAQGVP